MPSLISTAFTTSRHNTLILPVVIDRLNAGDDRFQEFAMPQMLVTSASKAQIR